MDSLSSDEIALSNAYFQSAQKHFELYITQNVDQFFKDETLVVNRAIYNENDVFEGPYEPWMELSCSCSWGCVNGERTFKYSHFGGVPSEPHQHFEVYAYYDEFKEIKVELKEVVNTSYDYTPLEIYMLFVETAIQLELKKETLQQQIQLMESRPPAGRPTLSVVR